MSRVLLNVEEYLAEVLALDTPLPDVERVALREASAAQKKALGALGTFVTGSGTSSEVLFGNVQLQAANTLGANETWLVAANSLGTSAGKMIAPQSIAIGCASCGLIVKDGEILGKIAKYAFAYAAVMAVLIYLGVLLGL